MPERLRGGNAPRSRLSFPAAAMLLLLAVLLHAGQAAAEGDEGAGGSRSKSRADSPLWPATPRDGAGLVLITLGLMIAAGGGIGA